MALIEGASSPYYQQDVEASKGARIVNIPRTIMVGGVGGSYKLSTVTGTMAAALGANSTVFAMRLDPSAPAGLIAQIDRIRLQFTTIVAFTTPVTVGRRLEIYRGSGAATSGGTTINPTDNSFQSDSNYPLSEMLSGQGGMVSVATTGALTVTSITYETNALAIMPLTHVGAAGGNEAREWEYNSTHENKPVIRPGELLAVRNPIAMDAAGTWQLGIEVAWTELIPTAIG
jgi:hypothetical protein